MRATRRAEEQTIHSVSDISYYKGIIMCHCVQLSPCLSLSVFTQQSFCRDAGVRCPSVNSGFSEISACKTKFNGKIPIHHTFKLFNSPFLSFKFQTFAIFFGFVKLLRNFTMLLLRQFSSNLNQTS